MHIYMELMLHSEGSFLMCGHLYGVYVFVYTTD